MKPSLSSSATVRQAPFTATLSPVRRPAKGARGAMAIRPLLRPVTSPRVSTIPLNNSGVSSISPYTVARHHEIRADRLGGDVSQEWGGREACGAGAPHGAERRCAADDPGRQHRDDLVHDPGVERGSEHRRSSLYQ